MNTQITPDQLGDHVGREVEVRMRAKIVGDGYLNFPDSRWHRSALMSNKATITLLPAPVPDEPTGLGAVVEVGSWRAVRADHKNQDPFITYTQGEFTGWRSWDRIVRDHPNLTVIHPGVEVPRV